MKNILITAGGTASAYFFCKVLRYHYGDSIIIHIADINEKKLIPAALLANEFHQVPPIADGNYLSAMFSLVEKKDIQLLVPLIDMDLLHFPKDDGRLTRYGCVSTAPRHEVSELLSDKYALSRAMAKINVPVPDCFTAENIEPDQEYFIKPRIGYGSRGAEKVSGRKLAEMKHLSAEIVIQELCPGPEITVEVFYSEGELDVICRERLEVKAGVCTKARIFHDQELYERIRVISDAHELPVASCFQFMRSSQKGWVLTDSNLRVGAGSALCAAVGWNLPMAAMSVWLGQPEKAASFLNYDGRERYVTRVFEEVVTV